MEKKGKRNPIQTVGRAPTFTILQKRVQCDMGGEKYILNEGDTLLYKKHGAFSIQKRGRCAVIWHTNLKGVEKRIVLLPKCEIAISRGRFKVRRVAVA